jgi:hypothetical protein
LIYGALIGLFRSSARREAEILVLRHQNNIDRLLFVLLSWLLPTTLDALTVIRPDTLIRWHRAGFRAYWRWKSRPRGGRPRTPPEIQRLIRDMSIANQDAWIADSSDSSSTENSTGIISFVVTLPFKSFSTTTSC